MCLISLGIVDSSEHMDDNNGHINFPRNSREQQSARERAYVIIKRND